MKIFLRTGTFTSFFNVIATVTPIFRLCKKSYLTETEFM